jgi:pathogenesis-related protein 1
MHRRPPFVILVAALAVMSCRSDRATAKTPEGREGEEAPVKAKRGEPAKAKAKRGDPEQGRLAGITAAHNEVRAGLDLPPLEWSPELARFAQAWADKLKKRGCALKHRPRSGADAQRYGENIFSMTGDTPSARIVVDSWAAELADYNPKTNRCKGVCGHYTQIVWRDSRKLGCAMAACGDTEVWVCNYDPPGNYVGKRPY